MNINELCPIFVRKKNFGLIWYFGGFFVRGYILMKLQHQTKLGNERQTIIKQREYDLTNCFLSAGKSRAN